MAEWIRYRRLEIRTAIVLALSALTGAMSLRGQAAPSKPDISQSSGALSEVPRFEVATIKPGTDDGHFSLLFTPDGVSIAGIAMQMILREAFLTEDDRIVGAPAWVKSTKYDIQAKVDAADAPKLDHLSIDQRRSMLLPLLVERFNMKYHHETRELPMYSLVIAKGGIKMKESKPDNPAAKNGHGQHFLRFMGRGHIESMGENVSLLVRVLSEQLGRSVVNKTGLTGSYDYTLQWTPDDAVPGMPGGAPPEPENAGDSVGPSLFTAVQEQLGLKLESGKGPADVIVIDRLDMPSPN